MRLSKPLRVVVGLLTGVYLVALVVVLGLMGVFVVGFTAPGTINNLRAVEITLIAFNIAGGLLQLALTAFYLVHMVVGIVRQRAVDAVQLAAGILTVLMPFVAMPVYFYAYIWPDEPPAWASRTPIRFKGGEPS